MAAPYGSGRLMSPFPSLSTLPSQQAVAHATGAGAAAMLSSPARDNASGAAALSGHKMSLICRRGQETVQEILIKSTEIFGLLRTFQLPNGAHVTSQQFTDRRNKLDESLRQLEMHFRRLRAYYDSVNAALANIDSVPAEELLPFEDLDINEADITGPESTKTITDEEKELTEQVRLKNRQLKDVIDHLRTVIWEINTMLTMRRTGSH